MSGKQTPNRVAKHEHHEHGPDCGHTSVDYKGRKSFVDDKHLHQKLGDQWRKVAIDRSVEHPDGCSSDGHDKGCWAHDDGETCGPDCGHEPVKHADHTDYLVPDGNGGFELHCPHDDHCDHHGHVKKSKGATKPPGP